jgi:hypothetical protein
MNKLIGYCEIGPDKVPAKIGLYTLEHVCKDFEVELTQIGSLFEQRTYVNAEGVEKTGTVPKDIHRFLRVLMFHSIDYAAKLGGTQTYSMIQIYELIDEIGGVNGDGCNELIAQFMVSIYNGGTPVKATDEGKKKETVQ